MTAFARAELFFQPKPLCFESGCFPRFSAHMGSRASAVRLPLKLWPPAMSATVSSSFIAMRAKFRGCRGRRRPDQGFRSDPRVDVDQTHPHGGKWVFEAAVAGVAFVIQPLHFPCPNKRRGPPQVSGAPAGEAECFEAHRFEGHDMPVKIIRSAQEIFRPYFLFDRQRRRRALSRLTLSANC